MASVRRYLIIGPAWVGDMIMAQSLFISLKQKYSDAVIDVVAPEWSLPLLSRMPEVNQAICLPVKHGEFGFFKRFKAGRSLKNTGYTHAIVIPRSYKSALLPFFSGIPQRSGYRGEMRYGLLNDIRGLNKNILRQTVQRQVALGLPATATAPPETPYPRIEVDKTNQQKIVSELDLQLDKPVVGFMPGAEYGPAKQWPIFKFHILASRLSEQGYRVWIYGSKKEQKLGASISSDKQNIINLCGKTELEDVIDLLALNACVVSNDSGLMHIAAAVATPLVAIYGSSTPAYTPPLTDAKHVIYLDLECSPCFDRKCRFGHTHCLNKIDVEQVEHAVFNSITGQVEHG